MSYVRHPPWYNVGTRIDRAQSTEAALNLGGMNWDVIKTPGGFVTPDGALMPIPNQFVMVRSDTQQSLGPVGTRYQPKQNREAFGFTEHLLKPGLRYDTTGIVGPRVFLSMVMPETTLLFEHDEYRFYLFVTHAHDRSENTRCRVIALRIASMAMLMVQTEWAIGAKQLAPAVEAHRALTEVFAAINTFEAQMNRLVATAISTDEFSGVIESLVAPGVRAEEKVREITDMFIGSPSMGPYGGTAYGALIAFAEWIDWQREVRLETARFTSSFDGDEGKRRAKLHNILLNL